MNIVHTSYSNEILDIPLRLLDSFGRIRVSNPMTVFDSKQLRDKQTLIWDDALVSGSGGASTFNSNNASTTLSVSSTTACLRVRQTFARFNYHPGKSKLFFFTGILGNPVSGNTKRYGTYDAKHIY